MFKLGNDVTVFTAKKGPDDLKFNFKVNRLPSVLRFGNAPILPKLLQINSVDVIHLHLPFFFGSELVYLTHKANGVPIVVTYHHDPILNVPLNSISLVYRYTLSKLFAEAKTVFATSIDYACNCNVRKALSKARLRELPIGVDTDRFNPSLDPSLIKKKLKIDNAETIILFVGGLDRPHYFKGLQYLISAFSKITNKKNCYLIVVGDGELKPFFIKQAQNLGITNRVLFAGRVPNETLPFFYAASDFLVLPSFTMSEAFGLVLIEAMACGKAVIASDIPGVRSVVSPYKNGFLVEPTNVDDLCTKMTYLIDDLSLRVKFGKNGRKKVETKYNWANIGSDLNNTLKEIVG